MTEIPEAAVKAALHVGSTHRTEDVETIVTSALEAALPHIRKQLAEEITEHRDRTLAHWEISAADYDEVRRWLPMEKRMYLEGMEEAALIVEGETNHDA